MDTFILVMVTKLIALLLMTRVSLFYGYVDNPIDARIHVKKGFFYWIFLLREQYYED